jgi:hypothetical protein
VLLGLIMFGVPPWAETFAELAARAPKLRKALAKAKRRARACLDRRHANPDRPGSPDPFLAPITGCALLSFH